MHQLVLFTALTTGFFGQAPQGPSGLPAPAAPAGVPATPASAGAPAATAPTLQPNAPVAQVVPVLPPAPFAVPYSYVPSGADVDGALVPAAWEPIRTPGTPVPPTPAGAVIPSSVRVISPAPYVVRFTRYVTPMTIAQPVRRGLWGRRIWWTPSLMPAPGFAPVGVIPATGFVPTLPPILPGVIAS